MVAEGPALGSRTCGKEMGIEGEKEGPLIDEVVARIAHKSNAVEEPPADKLSHDNHGIDG
jgi:hypothetical protein